MVSIARLSVAKLSSFGLPGQYGRRVTRVNSISENFEKGSSLYLPVFLWLSLHHELAVHSPLSITQFVLASTTRWTRKIQSKSNSLLSAQPTEKQWNGKKLWLPSPTRQVARKRRYTSQRELEASMLITNKFSSHDYGAIQIWFGGLEFSLTELRKLKSQQFPFLV